MPRNGAANSPIGNGLHRAIADGLKHSVFVNVLLCNRGRLDCPRSARPSRPTAAKPPPATNPAGDLACSGDVRPITRRKGVMETIDWWDSALRCACPVRPYQVAFRGHGGVAPNARNGRQSGDHPLLIAPRAKISPPKALHAINRIAHEHVSTCFSSSARE